MQKTAQQIMQLVTSLEAACTLTGDNPADEKFTRSSPAVNAFEQLSVVANAMRQGVDLSYEDVETEKHYCILQYVPGKGFRFWVASYAFAYAFAPGGSAFAMPTRELAIHFYTHPPFLALHSQFITNKVCK